VGVTEQRKNRLYLMDFEVANFDRVLKQRGIKFFLHHRNVYWVALIKRKKALDLPYQIVKPRLDINKLVQLQ
jgi:hypothetical protein